MFSGGRRRHRKSSPLPEEVSGGGDAAVPDGRRRSRTRSSNASIEALPLASPGGRKSASSQLPTHYHAPTNSTCNNFLLGGHYYPGKDKKRRHLRRRTFWHRWFCSSPSRVICSTLVVSYVALWYVLVPGASILMDYGRVLSGHAPIEDFSIDESSTDLENLRPTQEEKKLVELIRKERNKILFGGQRLAEKRKQLYKMIVPDWFREYETNGNGKGEDGNQGNKVDGTDHEGANRKATPLENSRPKHGKKDVAKTDAATNRVLRTLHNMDTLELPSSCPTNLLSSDIKTTLIVQCSLDRLWILRETCSRWKDPVVAVVYLRANDVNPGVSMELNEYETKFPHLKIITHKPPATEENWEYPVNILRNKGLNAVSTSHVLVADIDFVPSADLQEIIRGTLQDLQTQSANMNSTALVVPAFERMPPVPCDTAEDCAAFLKHNSSFIPHTFGELKSCVAGKMCSVFQQSMNWEGHFSTHSESWLKGDFYDGTKASENSQETNRSIKSIKCFDSLRYEPYVVLRWCPESAPQFTPRPIAPYYDERFYGYGKNKIELISHLRMMGYGFRILPRGFIVHNPHPESKAKETWNNKKDFDMHDKMDNLYAEFLKELWEKYKDKRESILLPCSQKK